MDNKYRLNALNKWKKVGPLTIEEILKNSDKEMDTQNIEFKTISKDSYTFQGQFKKGTDKREVICRIIFNFGPIY